MALYLRCPPGLSFAINETLTVAPVGAAYCTRCCATHLLSAAVAAFCPGVVELGAGLCWASAPGTSALQAPHVWPGVLTDGILQADAVPRGHRAPVPCGEDPSGRPTAVQGGKDRHHSEEQLGQPPEGGPRCTPHPGC